MKKELLTVGAMLAALCGAAQNHVADSFLQSSGSVANELVDDYLPLITAPRQRPDGTVLRYSMPVGEFKYVIVDYPEKGRYYGIVETDDVVGGSYLYLLGTNKSANDSIKSYAYRQPWDMRPVNKKPSGTYHVLSAVDLASLETRFMAEGVYNSNTTERSDPHATATVTFSPGGRLTYKNVITYTAKIGQEVEGEVSTTKRVNGRRRRRTTTQLTGGWYFDVKGTETFTGTWKMQNGELIVHYNERPTITVATSFNRQALIDGWRRESAMRGMEFSMDTYHRQYLAQAQADYPNYHVDEEKEILKDWMSEIPRPQDRTGYAVFAPDVVMQLIDGVGTKQYYKEEGMEYSSVPAYNLRNMTGKVQEARQRKPDGEAKYRRILADSLCRQMAGFSSINPGVGDWRLVGFDPASGNVRVRYLIGEGSAKDLWEAKAKADGFSIDLNELKRNAVEITPMGSILRQLEEGRAFLENALTDKAYKKGKKIAKNFFKEYGEIPVPTTYDNIDELERVRQAVQARIRIQNDFISQINAKINS